MHGNARSRVRLNGSLIDDFLVQVVLHKSSLLIPLLFITISEALSREIRLGCPEKFLIFLHWFVTCLKVLKGNLKPEKVHCNQNG